MQPAKLYEILKKRLSIAQSERNLCEDILREAAPVFDLACAEAVDRLSEEEKAIINKRLRKKLPSDQEEDKVKTRPSEETKTIYRKVATETHPDKQYGKSDPEAEKMSKKFTAAATAMNGGDYARLYEIADDLGIRLENPTPEEIEFIKDLLEKEKEKIDFFQKTVAWIWYHANTEEEKDLWMKKFLIMMIHQAS